MVHTEDIAFLSLACVTQTTFIVSLVSFSVMNREGIRAFLWMLQSDFRATTLGQYARNYFGFFGWGDPNVEQKICEKMVECSRRYACVLFLLTLLATVSFQWSMLVERTMVFQRPFCWVVLIVHIVSLLLTSYPRLISTKTLNFWYCFGSVVTVVTLLPSFAPPEEKQMWSVMTFAAFRLPATGITTRISLVLTSNIGCLAAVIYGYAADNTKTYESGGDALYVAAWFEAILFVLVTATAVSQRLSLTEQVQRKVSQSRAEAECGAATSLLRLTCDAVIELDEDLRLLWHSEDLATMLLRSRPGASVKGMYFSDFLPQSETARAVNLLCSHLSMEDHACQFSSAVAQAFHTRLVDSCGSQFRTEIFHVRYGTWDGSTRHLIGLRDFTDQGSLMVSRADASLDRSHGSHESDERGEVPTVEVPPDEALPLAPTNRSRGSGHSIPYEEDLPPLDEAQHSEKDIVTAQQMLNLLEINMEDLMVDAASASIAFLAGRPVVEIFRAKGLQLLLQVQEQAAALDEQGQLGSRNFTYGDCALRWSHGHWVYVTGVIHVCKTKSSRTFIMSFATPTRVVNTRRRTRRRSGSRSLGSPSQVVPQSLERTHTSL